MSKQDKDPAGYLPLTPATFHILIAGRNIRPVNLATVIMLSGVLVSFIGTVLMVFGLEIGWYLWPMGTVIHGLGLMLMGAVAHNSRGFLPYSWLATLLGAISPGLMIVTLTVEQEAVLGLMLVFLGATWLLLGVLLFNSGADAAVQPPTIA